MAHEISPEPHPREMDMLLSTGERISCALCAMALNDLGTEAISLSGSQAGIVTDTSHTKARILDVRADRIRAGLEEGRIVLVAGFQGVSTSRDVTTLGRGGSDTTAVALAAALGAEVCEIYTDVDGVFSADPRIVPDARRLPLLSFEEMLEMSASGARCCSCARSSTRATMACDPREAELRRRLRYPRSRRGRDHGTPLITAVTHSTDDARVTLTGVPDRPGIAARIFGALAAANVNVDMIVQNEPVSTDRSAEISFTVPKSDVNVARRSLEALTGELGLDAVITKDEMGKVSVVGAGMRSHPGVAAKVFETLGEKEINIEMISTSPIKISCVIAADRVPDAVRALHDTFELGKDEVEREDGGPR